MSKRIIEKDWLTKSGFRAAVIKQETGHRCGYVMIPDGHRYDAEADFDVHGGITYRELSKSYPVENETPLLWIGFDCAHFGDNIPGIYTYPDGIDWTLEKVVAECEDLASQL